jgi:hypothetical protein
MTPKALWIDALKSGRYAQCQNTLKDETGYCCLGVLGDVLLNPEYGKCNAFTYYANFKQYDYKSFVALPAQVLSHNIQKTLMDMNDNGKSFEEIADYIQENVKEEDIKVAANNS